MESHGTAGWHNPFQFHQAKVCLDRHPGAREGCHLAPTSCIRSSVHFGLPTFADISTLPDNRDRDLTLIHGIVPSESDLILLKSLFRHHINATD